MSCVIDISQCLDVRDRVSLSVTAIVMLTDALLRTKMGSVPLLELVP